MTGFSTQQYVAGYDTQVLKPVIPKLNIAVPTALKGTQSVTAPIVKTRVDNYVVNAPVHVQRPYEVPVPVPVRGQDIVKVSRTAPIVKHTHAGTYAAPAVGIAAAPAVGIAAAPAV